MTTITLDASQSGACRWCSTPTRIVAHGGPCPHVQRIEFHPDGSVKSVEFKGYPVAAEFPPGQQPPFYGQ